jgi:hypothetical protein
VNRFAQQDFDRLRLFLEQYRLEPDLGAKVREELAKRSHKQTLAALQVLATVQMMASKGDLSLKGTKVPVTGDSYPRLEEFFSDLVSSMFASLHGLYKPALMSLRSAIENFVRACAGLKSAEARATTSVYRLFEIAAKEPIFLGQSAPSFTQLHQQYGELCLYAHTSTVAHMTKSVAMANYPRQDTVALRGVVKRLEQTIPAALSVLTFSNRRLYLDVPARARDLLDEVLPLPAKTFALGG